MFKFELENLFGIINVGELIRWPQPVPRLLAGELKAEDEELPDPIEAEALRSRRLRTQYYLYHLEETIG